MYDSSNLHLFEVSSEELKLRQQVIQELLDKFTDFKVRQLLTVKE
jgi:hypothetical protein